VNVAPAEVEAERGFPLVPRRPLHGLELGPFRGVRRGVGSDPAGSRPYRPGDDVRTIDWGASARLSAARGAVEFVVRERFAEQAPRVVLATDRRPGMALHAPPWLPKPDVLTCAESLIADSAFRARGLVGSLHFVGDEIEWTRPTGNPRTWRTRPTATSFVAAPGSLADGIEQLVHARALPPGSFLFVLSDFLDPVPEAAWLTAITRGWDVVPVVVQDPTWEASFPVSVGGLVLPLADPVDGRTELVRLSVEQARLRRNEHEARLAGIVGAFAELGLDAIVLHSADQDAILTAFLDWAAARLLPEGRL
jgi:uncharacterized protein (DUF58 family)